MAKAKREEAPVAPPAPDLAPVDDDAADDAFDAARDALATEARQAASEPTRRERTAREKQGNRWRARDARRKAAGEPPLTEAEQRAKDAEAGITDDAAVPRTSSGASAGASSGASGKARRATREELEAELATLRARLDIEDQENIKLALGETARTIWDVARRFTPSEDRALNDGETDALGEVWAKVLGPRMAAMAHATPMVVAIGVSYRIMAPRVEGAFTSREVRPAVAAGSATRRDFAERAEDPAPPATAPQAPVGVAEVPPGADPTKYGYSPEVD